jgi:hypothetical protein
MNHDHGVAFTLIEVMVLVLTKFKVVSFKGIKLFGNVDLRIHKSPNHFRHGAVESTADTHQCDSVS